MMDITFKFPEHGWYMVVPVVALILLLLGWKKKKGILDSLKIEAKTLAEKVRIGLMVLGLVVIGLAIMAPVRLDGTISVKKEGLDMYILLDTSKSMLVEDMAPNRLEREKEIVEGILDQLSGDRVGFIPFSSSAYVQMPLTNDYNMASMFLEVVDTNMIGGGGSDVGAAIELAIKSFDEAAKGDKVILVISDGEEHGQVNKKTTAKIKDEDLYLYTIGVGTVEGGLIPEYDGQGQVRSYKQDKNGNHIVSKLNDATLKELASVGRGHYYQSSLSGSEVEGFIKDMATLERQGDKTSQINHYSHLYMYFLAVGVVLFLLGYLIPVRRKI